MEMSALDWMMKTFPQEKDIERMRKFLGRYGLTGKQQVCMFHLYVFAGGNQKCNISPIFDVKGLKKAMVFQS